MRFRRFHYSFCRFFWSLAILLTSLSAANAADSEVFTVRNVAVDATAAAAAGARDAALAQGYIDAYARLIRRLVPLEEQPRVPELTAQQITDYTTDFSVARERTSNVRYLADITYRFQPEAIQRLLKSNGIGFAESRSKPMLILPLHALAGREVLWEDGNLWRDAWSVWMSSDGLVPLIVPLGDLNDISSISANDAVSGDVQRLSALAGHYGAGTVLISRSELLGNAAAGNAELQVSQSRFEVGGYLQPFGTEIVRQMPEETMERFLQRAANAVDASVQERWKRSNVLQYGVEATIKVLVPLTGLGDWVEIQKRLSRVPAIIASGVQTISKRQVELSLTYAGDERQLTLALAQNDLTLSLSELLVWELRLSDSDRPVSGGIIDQSSPRESSGGGVQQQNETAPSASGVPEKPESVIQPEGVSD
jgi:hypothetical protein